MDDQQLIERDINGYLERHQNKELLRFVTVGSVDDGKSTLIGRLLHDTHGIYEDQLSAVKRASSRAGKEEMDFAFFTDGLKAEREQGITIDVAYRYFSTEKRKFIIADTPGHVQYTRNMATGASTAHVALILIDARLGVLQQSRRHAYIASLLGIGHLAVCVNKMDLVAFDEGRFEEICHEFRCFVANLAFESVTFFPISAKQGDNIVHRGESCPWYRGSTVLEYLEGVPLPAAGAEAGFRLPVQLVLRPNLDYRAIAGTVASGIVKPGDEVMVLPSRRRTRVEAIDSFEGELPLAFAPMSVALRLADHVDVSRGDTVVHAGQEPRESKRFEATLVWMSEKGLDRQKSYFLKHTTQVVRAQIPSVSHTVDLDSLQDVAAERLELNDIGRVTVACQKPLFFDPYTKNRATGAFIVIDPISSDTVAAGMISEAESPVLQDDTPPAELGSLVSSHERLARLGQVGCVVWLTGLPASGKSEIAYQLERRLFDEGRAAVVVDPDDGMTHCERAHGSSPLHAPELAERLAQAGLVGIFAFGSPLRTDRAATRDRVGEARFVEIHVDTPLDTCQQRDRRGAYDPHHELPHHEAPTKADLKVSVAEADAGAAASRIYDCLRAKGLIS